MHRADLRFANTGLIRILWRRSIVVITRRRSLKHTPKSKGDVKERKESVFLITEIFRRNIVDSVKHPVEARLVDES